MSEAAASVSAVRDGSEQVAVALAANHVGTIPQLDLPTGPQAVAGLAAGLGIGIVAALMGVAGGELLIPTIVLLTPST